MTMDERDQSYLVMVKAWDPSDWTMTDLVEVWVPKTATLSDFGAILHAKFTNIELANIECTKINSSWNFSRVQLPFESWNVLEQGSELYVASAPYYVQTDGLFFVIRDKTKEGREMTDEERDKYRSDDYENRMFAAPSSSGKPGARYVGRPEAGIKITVKSKAQSNEE